MRAVTQSSFGDASTLQLSKDVPLPALSSRHVLIRVHYSALNRMDIMQVGKTLYGPMLP